MVFSSGLVVAFFLPAKHHDAMKALTIPATRRRRIQVVNISPKFVARLTMAALILGTLMAVTGALCDIPMLLVSGCMTAAPAIFYVPSDKKGDRQ